MRRKFGWNYRGCAHPGDGMPRNTQAREINDDFHDPQNEETRGIKAGMHWRFPKTHAASNRIHSPLPPCLPLVSCRRLHRDAFVTFVFSQVLPISGWHQFHARSHPICPIVVGGNATAHLGHVFVMSYHQSPHGHEFRLVSTSSHDSPKAVDLRWQPSDMAWTSTPRRLRHGGPASPTLAQ